MAMKTPRRPPFAQAMLDANIDALVQQIARLERKRNALAAQRADAAMAAFARRHPDWQAHEPAMVALAQRAGRIDARDEPAFLEWLYRTVTARKSLTRQRKKRKLNVRGRAAASSRAS